MVGLKFPDPGVIAPEERKAETAADCHAGWVATLEKPPPLVMSAALASEATTYKWREGKASMLRFQWRGASWSGEGKHRQQHAGTRAPFPPNY